MESETTEPRSLNIKILILAVLALLFIHCGGGGTAVLDAGVPDGPVCVPKRQWVSLNSSMQLVTKLVDENFCPSGWTELYTERLEENAEQAKWIPLQPEYVQRFASVRQFGDQLAASWSVLGQALPTTRFSLSWPCILASAEIQDEFEEALAAALDKGYRVELVLSQRDSYPAQLHKISGGLDLPGGWAHPDASQSFGQYVEAVLDLVGTLLPDGSVIYIAHEPNTNLFDGYVRTDGKYPPGGKSAGKSLAVALLNARDAYMAAGRRLREAGYVPAIAPNIRRVTQNEYPEPAIFLDELYNNWLLDALVEGCIDDDFDGVCESKEDPAVDVLGITFYGVMHASTATVEFGLPSGPTRPLPYRDIQSLDSVSDSERFDIALTLTRERYKRRIEEGTLQFGVAEVGFTDVNITQKIIWLQGYLGKADEAGATFFGLHGMFEQAEFQNGQFNFHMIARCPDVGTDGPCELTDWGQAVLDIIALDCTSVP